VNVAAFVQSAAHRSQDEFFGWPLALWCLVPFALAIWLARRRKRVEPEPPHVTDATFEDLVLRSEIPTLVHFYRAWSVGDRVMVNQAKRIAARNAGRSSTLWCDVETCPESAARFPHLTTPAFVFFVDGTAVYHAEGVVDEADVVREMWLAHDAFLKRRARDAESGRDGALAP